LSAFRILQRLVSSYLGMGALNRLHRYIYDCAYGLPQWREISTFNYGYAPSDDSVAELWPNEPHHIQLYAEVAKAVRAARGRTAPSRRRSRPSPCYSLAWGDGSRRLSYRYNRPVRIIA
jgi:hypothetical protein